MIKNLLNHKTLRNKFLYLLMMIAVLSASITSVALIYYETKDAEANLENKLELMSSVITPSLTAALVFNDLDTLDELIVPTIKTEGILSTAVYSDTGQLVAQVSRGKFNEQSYDMKNAYIAELQLDNSSVGRLVFYADYSVISTKLDFYISLVAQLLAGTLALSLIFSLYFSRAITSPLSNLIQLANQVISAKDYSLRAKQLSQDEIGDLTDCFNKMLEKVEQRDAELEAKVAERTKALAAANEKLHLQANEDTLSGLPNRRSLYKHLQQSIQSQVPFCLLFIDLDGFKKVNDVYGHDCGDELLQHASARILSCVKSDDFVARLGGDEFMVILNNLTDTDRINAICEQMLAKLSDVFSVKNETVNVSASVGVTLFPEDGNLDSVLIKNADSAMYEAKKAGKNCFHYFSKEVQSQYQAKDCLVKDVYRAIEREEFELYYQPIAELKTGKIKKVEALIRWQHPSKGIVLPDNFLPIIEEEKLMEKLGYWIVNKASQDILYWQQQYNMDINVSINVSPSQFKSKKCLLKKWVDSIEALGLKDNSITIEITENSLMENSENVHSLMAYMREKGIKVAIDDFGVGYSSLAYLQQLELDVLKIDKSFVANLAGSENSYRLLKGMIAIGKELGLSVVAEGIETEEQRLLLLEAGCEFGQGYIFAKPMPKQQLEQFVSCA